MEQPVGAGRDVEPSGQEAGHDGKGDLQAYRVVRMAGEVADAQILLQPVEEPFDPPADAAGAGSISTSVAVRRWLRDSVAAGADRAASSSRNSSLACAPETAKSRPTGAGTSA